MQIEPYNACHLEAVVRLSLRAWEPVFDSLRAVLHPDLYCAMIPDWRSEQTKTVTAALAMPEMRAWVADEDGATAGFVAARLLADDPGMGEIYLLAVDPDHQNRGVGTALTEHALAWLRQAGASIAMVETGGDPGHAPARRTYEKAGFGLLPIARYYKKL
jgi:GNAT superfamily N-acetyltransferase